MESKKKEMRPLIVCVENGPYKIVAVEKIVDSDGKPLTPKNERMLCRCGHTKYQPFCDGTHIESGFDSKNENQANEGVTSDAYIGEEITIYLNKSLCAKCDHCHYSLPYVFGEDGTVNVDPNDENLGEIIEIIRQCPSGALSYSLDNDENNHIERDAAIHVEKNGPYKIQGGIDLVDVKKGDRASDEHYTLCRCGNSKNKPFCDGSHKSTGFREDGFISIAKLSELNNPLTRVTIRNKEMVIVKHDDILNVFSGLCLHMEELMSEGFIDGNFLTCGKHLWRYDVETGVLDGDPSMGLKKMTIEMDGDFLMVKAEEVEELKVAEED